MFQARSARPPGAEPDGPSLLPPGWGRPLFLGSLFSAQWTPASFRVDSLVNASKRVPSGSALTAETVSSTTRELSTFRFTAYRGLTPLRHADDMAHDLPETASDPAPATAPVLALIHDSRLRDEVRRVAAAAGRRLDERAAPVGRHPWTAAPLVVLDTEAAETCARTGHPRRPGVVTVTAGEAALDDWQAAAAIGAEHVIALPGSAVGLIEKFAEHAENRAEGGLVLAVAGAVGGAGASTLAAATALRSATGGFRRNTVLIDGAPHGGGIDLLLGIEKAPGLRWPDLVVENGRVSATALHNALPEAVTGLSVLSCGRDSGARSDIGSAAVHAVIEASHGAGDLVVCDVSSERGPHAGQMLDAADLVVLVVPAQLRAVAAARTVAAHIARRNPNQGLLVRGPAPGSLRGHEIAEVLDLPLLAAVRAQPGLPARLERGGLTLRRGPLRDACDAVLSVLHGPAEELAR